MKLYEAIEYAINKNGTDIICEQRFANYLADLQAYETPAVRRIITAIMREGYCKKLDSIRKQIDECREYHDRLHVVADEQIAFDLDDGVVVNYAKFGDVVQKIK